MGFDVNDLVRSSPLVLLTVAGMLLLLLDAFSRMRIVGKDYHKKLPAETSEAIALPVAGSRTYLMPVTLVTLLATLMLLAWLAPQVSARGESLYSNMLVLDRFGLFASAVCVVGAAFGVMTAPAFLRAHRMEFGEYYALILLSLAGMVILIMASDLVTLFIGVETMSLGVYVLTGSWRRSARSSEAAMKYFLVGAFISGLFVYGIALIYGTVGTTGFAEIKARAPGLAAAPMFYLGWLLLLVTFAFKIAAVPFHMWAPDTYEGAPTPVSGFMMASVKSAAFAGLVRLCAGVMGSPESSTQPFTGWVHVLSAVAVLTMTLGNLAALRQDNIKRMLAYSSISHAGYLLVGVVALGQIGDEARGPLLYYLMAYTLTTVGGMGVVAWLGCDEHGEERVRLEDWAGLGIAQPLPALAMTVFLLSLGGFPPTAGFFGKFYLFRAALSKPGLMSLILVAIANSLVSVFYYLRVITTMYFRPEPKQATTVPLRSTGLTLAVVATALLVLVLGAMPEWLVQLSASAVLGE